jgi:hypothetical protein
LAFLPPFCIFAYAILSAVTYHIFMTRTKTTLRNSKALYDRPPFQMRTISLHDEAAPWSRSNQLMGTRFVPLSDDHDNNFSRIHEEQELR